MIFVYLFNYKTLPNFLLYFFRIPLPHPSPSPTTKLKNQHLPPVPFPSAPVSAHQLAGKWFSSSIVITLTSYTQMSELFLCTRAIWILINFFARWQRPRMGTVTLLELSEFTTTFQILSLLIGWDSYFVWMFSVK